MLYPDEIAADSPFGYWRFPTGRSYRDEQHLHNLTRGSYGQGTWEWWKPLIRQWNEQNALFNGTSDYAATSQDTFSTLYWPDFGDLTIEFMVRTGRNKGRETLLSLSYFYQDPGHIQGWEVYLVDGKLRASVPKEVLLSTATSEMLYELPTAIVPHRWHHVVIVYKKTVLSTDKGCIVWIDGQKAFEDHSNVNFKLNPFVFDLGPIYNGLWMGQSSSPSGTNPFKGELDEVAIYDYALSDERVIAHWEASGLKEYEMPTERATVYEDSIWRVEDTLGSGTGNLYRLLNTEVTFDPDPLIRTYRKTNSKFVTSSSVGKEISMGSLSGDQAINDTLFLLRSLMTKGDVSTPTNNGIWTVGVGAATAGNFTLTYGGDTTANIAYNASAAAVRTALAALDSIGSESLVLVTGASPTWTVRLLGYLSTGGALTITPVALTDGTATSTSSAGGTARRWIITPSWNAADDPQTYEIQKGVFDLASGAAKADKTFISSVAFKWTTGEASLTGDVFANLMEDPFTMETAGITDLPVIPVDPACISMWMGDGIEGADMPILLDRLMTVDLNFNGKWAPLRTLNCYEPGLTNGVETAPTSELQIVVEHNEFGQGLLQDMREGQTKIIVFEALASDINANYPHRLKWIASARIVGNSRGDLDGVYCSTYNLVIQYSTLLGYAIRFIIDTTLASF